MMRRLPPHAKEKSALFWAASLVASQCRTDTHAAASPDRAPPLSDSVEAIHVAQKNDMRVGHDNPAAEAHVPHRGKRARDSVNRDWTAEGEEHHPRQQVCGVGPIEIDIDNEEVLTCERNVCVESPGEDAHQLQQQQSLENLPPCEAVGPARGIVRLKDVLPVADALLQGHLGPVGIGVDLGGTASISNPDAFERMLNEMERSTGGGDLRGQLDAVQIFLSLRGESFYTIDHGACPPIVFLARLLSAPAVIKIVLRAQNLYRLLFLYLGTDRVEVNNVVDVNVWTAVAIRMGHPLQQKVNGSCVTIKDVWRLIPETTQELIQLRLSENAVAVCADEINRGKNHNMKSLGGDESSDGAAWVQISIGHIPTADLMREFRDLAALHAFYDGHLSELTSRGALGELITSVADVCHLETYTSFLCEVMSFHGVMVNKPLFDLMIDDIDQQVAVLIDKGNTALRSEGASDENDMDTITAEDLSVLLVNLRGGHAGDSVSKTQAIQHLSTLAAEEGEYGGPAYIWLSIREYRDLKKTLWGMFVNGSRVRTRLIVNTATTENGGATQTTTRAVTGPTATVTEADGTAVGLFFSVHPQWAVHHNTTGRIYCSHPSLQILPKQPPSCRVLSRVSSPRLLFRNSEWTQRHLFGPPPGCTLLSFDFNQIELRVLAHLSRDEALIAHLTSGRDVLSEMAKHMLALNAVDEVTPLQRQAAKVVVYGLLYGMGPERMDERIAQLHMQTSEIKRDPESSSRLMESSSSSSMTTTTQQQQQQQQDLAHASMPSAFHIMRAFSQCYPGAHGFLKNTRITAFHQRRCVTINGVHDLSNELDGNRRKQLSVALSIQGSAATIMHHAMNEVHRRRHKLIPFIPAAPLALVLTVHDELVYAVPDAVLGILAPAIKGIIEGRSAALKLRVPLCVSVRHGKSLGTMTPMEI